MGRVTPRTFDAFVAAIETDRSNTTYCINISHASVTKGSVLQLLQCDTCMTQDRKLHELNQTLITRMDTPEVVLAQAMLWIANKLVMIL
jgi:hypothetical protein